MTIEGFTSFLLSSDNMAMDERQLTICDDMTRPLCEYYVSSSHNVSRELLSFVEEQMEADAYVCIDLSRWRTA